MERLLGIQGCQLMINNSHSSFVSCLNKLSVYLVHSSISLDSLLCLFRREGFNRLVLFIPVTGVSRVESIQILLQVIAEPSL